MVVLLRSKWPFFRLLLAQRVAFTCSVGFVPKESGSGATVANVCGDSETAERHEISRI